jgi:hypothetical protein
MGQANCYVRFAGLSSFILLSHTLCAEDSLLFVNCLSRPDPAFGFSVFASKRKQNTCTVRSVFLDLFFIEFALVERRTIDKRLEIGALCRLSHDSCSFDDGYM